MAQKKMKKNTPSFEVLGRKWKIVVCSEEEYAKENRPGTVAITDAESRCIKVLGQANVSYSTVAHELVHAFIAELCLSSADLDNDNLEEIFAELFANRAEEMVKIGKRMFKKLKQA